MISAEIPRTPFLNRNLFENARDDSRGVCLGQELKTNCKDCKLPDFNVNGGQKRVNSGRWPVVGVIIISECRPILHICICVASYLCIFGSLGMHLCGCQSIICLVNASAGCNCVLASASVFVQFSFIAFGKQLPISCFHCSAEREMRVYLSISI